MQIKKRLKQFWNWYVKLCEDTCEYGAQWEAANERFSKKNKNKTKGKKDD
jgi:hypothetical protein